MSPAQADLARQLVALPGWGWRPRMRVLLSGRGGRNEGTIVAAWADDAGSLVIRWDTGHRETPVADIGRAWGSDEHEHGDRIAVVATRPIELLPDLTNDATAGVLLGMLRGVEGVASVEVLLLRASVAVTASIRGARAVDYGSTLAEAVANALVAVGRCA